MTIQLSLLEAVDIAPASSTAPPLPVAKRRMLYFTLDGDLVLGALLAGPQPASSLQDLLDTCGEFESLDSVLDQLRQGGVQVLHSTVTVPSRSGPVKQMHVYSLSRADARAVRRYIAKRSVRHG